jgi:hypothetical protein
MFLATVCYHNHDYYFGHSGSFLGFFIHDDSETGSVSILRDKEEVPAPLDPLK